MNVTPFADAWNQRHSSIVRRAMVLRSDDLSSRVVSGAAFTFLGIFLRTAMTIGSMAILARLLTPADFGYIAMATVITELASMFVNFGLSSVLIQRRVVARLHFDTVFWASAFLGVASTGTVFVLSFFAVWLFNDPLTGELLRVLCITFLFASLTLVHDAILARLMLFHTVFWIEVGTIATRIVVAIVFAWNGFGVWSLVAGSIAGSILHFMCNVILVHYVPRFRFNRAYLVSIWRTSSSYFLSGVLYYINMNVDLVLIGRELGSSPLGFYQNARSLTDEVRARIAMPLQRVLFPAFSSIQTDLPRLQASVTRSARILAAVICPVGFGLSAVSSDLVPVLYGEQWLAMIPVLSMFGISAALRGSTAIASPLFNSQNRVGLALRYNLVGMVLMVAGVIVTLPHGLNAIAIAIALSSLYSLVTFRAGIGVIGLKTKHVRHILGAPFLAASIMWLSIYGIKTVDFEWLHHPAVALPALIVMGSIVYSLALLLFSRQFFSEFKQLVEKMLNRSHKAA